MFSDANRAGNIRIGQASGKLCNPASTNFTYRRVSNASARPLGV